MTIPFPRLSGAQLRTAAVLTEVTAPAPTAILLLLAVALHAAPSVGSGLWWGLSAVLFTAVIPFSFILLGVRKGHWSDHHVGEREKRPVPLAAGIASVAVGVALLGLAGAPRQLFALVVAMLVGLGVTLAVTAVWKVSIHTSVTGGAAVILVLIFGPALFAVCPLLAAIAWARVRLSEHTPAQAAAGIALGAAVAGTVFPLAQ